MICQEDHDQILADPNATTDELRSIIAELQADLRKWKESAIRHNSAWNTAVRDITRLRGELDAARKP